MFPVELALKLKSRVAARAKENQIAAQNNNAGRAVLQKSEKLLGPIHTDEEIAKRAGISRDTIRKVGEQKDFSSPRNLEMKHNTTFLMCYI